MTTHQTMPKHTPGPWRLPEGPTLFPDGIRVADEQDVTIATVWKQPYDPSEWAEANARLIAAAPELHSAGEQLHHAVVGLLKAYAEVQKHYGLKPEDSPIYAEAREANRNLVRVLAKATGDGTTLAA